MREPLEACPKPPMKTVGQALSIARKDLAIELRTKESLNAAAAFAVAILVLLCFVFDVTSPQTRESAGGLLWLVFAFAGALVFNRGFAREQPNECLDALLASPLPRSSLLVGKAFANLATLLVVEFVSLIVFGILYDIRWWLHVGQLAVACVLATWGISIVGAVFGALTVNLRLRELMLPVIVYPLLIPLLIAAIEITNLLFSAEPSWSDRLLWGRLLIVFDIVFTALALALADTILIS